MDTRHTPNHRAADTPEWVQALQSAPSESKTSLDSERSTSDIDVSALSLFLFSPDLIQKRQDILDVLRCDPIFDKAGNHYHGPVEKLKVAITRGKRLRVLAVKHAWSDEGYQIAADLI